ncbi:MAG TPA: ABC transporter substrate-binding protein [Oscillatoriales cyanobacterium M59_W2019_021]|nr:ABC transporter substrate-binding protein [Oscillatoriales cyanobacterium M4454_W2019_049]HIK53190.1 ABC transporter substrate-binding protein [Oscillatoriales cyanobacterium M59_W2019_021]
MDRRKFLKYSSLAAAGFTIAACGGGGEDTAPEASETSSAAGDSPAVDFGELEKTDLTIGIIPLTDCAPLVIAKEKGFFEKYGLNVTISKEASWATVRDGLIQGRLDASHALCGMPMLTQLGEEKAPMRSLMMLDRNGNAMTLSKAAWDAGIRPLPEYASFDEFGKAYREYITGQPDPPTFAMVFPSSMHNYNTRYWMAAMGIDPDNDVKLIVIPPPQMVENMKAGTMDGYCVGEPWNQRAVFDGAGFTCTVDRDVWNGHPEKVLGTMQGWIDANPNTAKAMVAAVIEACEYCDVMDNRLEVVEIISGRPYVNAKVDYAKASMTGTYDYGGFDEEDRVKEIPDFNLFNFIETDYMKKPDNANYPYASHGVWLLTQMIRWNQIDMKEYPADADKLIAEIYPTGIYEEVAKAMGKDIPTESMKKEPGSVFIDGREFDPSDPVAYLNGFDIRAGRPQIFAFR